MKYTEFLDLFDHIKRRADKKYELGFLYFTRQLEEGFHQDVLVPLNNWSYLIPYGIYKKEGYSSYFMDFLGCYNSLYNPCEADFLIDDNEWYMIDVCSKYYSYDNWVLELRFKNRENDKIQNVSYKGKVRDIRELSKCIRESLLEKKEV